MAPDELLNHSPIGFKAYKIFKNTDLHTNIEGPSIKLLCFYLVQHMHNNFIPIWASINSIKSYRK